MSKVSEVNIHLHIHEGASPEAVRAAVKAAREQGDVDPGEAGRGGEAPDDRAAEFVRRAYQDSEEKAKPLLEFLADNPDRLVPYPEVSEHLRFETARSLPGLLGAFSRRADHRYGGRQPFERRETLDGWCLFMPQENAAIINELRG